MFRTGFQYDFALLKGCVYKSTRRKKSARRQRKLELNLLDEPHDALLEHMFLKGYEPLIVHNFKEEPRSEEPGTPQIQAQA